MYDLVLKEDDFVHVLLYRIARGEDIRILKQHPLIKEFLDRLDIELRDILNHWGDENVDAYLRQLIKCDSTVSSILWNPLEDGFLNDGDEITIVNKAEQRQTFTISEDVSLGDTSLNIRSEKADYAFIEGDHIYLSNDGYIYRRFENVTGKNIIVDLPLPDISNYSLAKLSKIITFLKNGNDMVLNRTAIQGIDYGYTISGNTIVLGIDSNSTLDVYELYLKNPHLYA